MFLRKSLFCNVLFLILCLHSSSAEIQPVTFNIEEGGESQNIQLLLTSDKNVYSPCEPIILTITATNISDSTMSFLPMEISSENFKFSVFNQSENGKSNLSMFGQLLYKDVMCKSFSGGLLFLKPDDTYKKKFQIDRIYDMSLSGEYIISSTFHFVDYNLKISTYAVSNPIQIQISKENPCISVDRIGIVSFSNQRESDRYTTKRENNEVKVIKGILNEVASKDIIVEITSSTLLAKPYEPIFIQVVVKNVSEKEVHYADSSFTKDYRMVVMKEGLAVEMTPQGKILMNDDDFFRYIICILPTGHQIQNTILINRLFEMSLPGEYQITLSRRFSTPEIPNNRISSNILSITILDDDFYELGRDRIINASGEIVEPLMVIPESMNGKFFNPSNQ